MAAINAVAWDCEPIPMSIGAAESTEAICKSACKVNGATKEQL